MLKQFLNLKLSQKLSPQQIQLMKLIQWPTQAFEQRLKEEMNENPALETGKEDEELYEKDDYDNTDDYEDNEISGFDCTRNASRGDTVPSDNPGHGCGDCNQRSLCCQLHHQSGERNREGQ